MEITQLQGLISECCRLQKFLEQSYEYQQREKLDVQTLRKLIRKSRIQILNLRYELKYDLKDKIERNRNETTLRSLQREIKNTESINSKIFQEYKQLNQIVTKTRKKIDHIEIETKKILRELQLQNEYKMEIQQFSQLESTYWSLRSKLQYQYLNQKEEQNEYSMLFKEKKSENMQLNSRIEELSQKYQQTEQNVKIQREIIEQIKKFEKEQNKSDREETVKILGEKEEKEFNKDEDLNPFQQFELENILQKKEFQRKQEYHRMGKILHQKGPKMNFGKIVSLKNRKHYNKTEMLSLNHLKTDPNAQIPSTKLNLSHSVKLQELQKRKRIRTRQTEMQRYSQHYKNFLQKSSSFDDSKEKSKDILQLYDEAKKNRVENRKMVGNIEIIKFLKRSNKKKVLQQGKGIALECEYQNEP